MVDTSTRPVPDVLDRLHHGLVVSSQVMDPRSPLDDPDLLARLAQAALLGGAVGARVASAPTVAALRSREPSLPIIGLTKRRRDGLDNYITPSVDDALELLRAGADIVAVQATRGSRMGASFAEIARAVHAQDQLVMADVSTRDEALDAVADGADMVGTTMVGFTPSTEHADRPAIALVEGLASALDVPVVLEGSVWTPEDVAAGFAAGAHTVVAGSAITAPDRIAARLSAAAPSTVGPAASHATAAVLAPAAPHEPAAPHTTPEGLA
jgi:N-acylglucosamine-6-phosphate 2-epimerase